MKVCTKLDNILITGNCILLCRCSNIRCVVLNPKRETRICSSRSNHQIPSQSFVQRANNLPGNRGRIHISYKQVRSQAKLCPRHLTTRYSPRHRTRFSSLSPKSTSATLRFAHLMTERVTTVLCPCPSQRQHRHLRHANNSRLKSNAKLHPHPRRNNHLQTPHRRRHNPRKSTIPPSHANTQNNLNEFAFQGISRSSIGGQVRNPYDFSRTPGGSSGGTGVSIAANFAMVGIGTDTMNSVLTHP